MGPKKQIKKQVVEPPPQEVPPPIPPHQLQGFGKFQYLDGTIYEGKWKLINGKKTKHGEGVLKIPGNLYTNIGEEIYEGGWQEDEMSGFGIYKYANGATYKGQWKNNRHHGKGQYQFPNGTIYNGQWQNHLMHGTGYYIDVKGRKWEGQFRNGRYQSKLQKQLCKEKQLVMKKKQLSKDILLIIQKMLEVLGKSDKKSLKENFSPFFPSGEIIKEQVRDVAIKFDERPTDKWVELLNILKNGKINILTNVTEAQVLPGERILKPQMEGPGQIVQVMNSRDEKITKGAFVNVEGVIWVLCYFYSDEEKKGK